MPPIYPNGSQSTQEWTFRGESGAGWLRVFPYLLLNGRRRRRKPAYSVDSAGHWTLVRRPAAPERKEPAAPERKQDAIEHVARTLLALMTGGQNRGDEIIPPTGLRSPRLVLKDGYEAVLRREKRIGISK